MFRSKLLFIVSLFVLLAAACAPAVATPVPTEVVPVEPVEPVEPSIPVTGLALVESIEIQILESMPVQVNAIVRGQLPDAGCTTISSIDQSREGRAFLLTITTTTDPLALCAQALTPFERSIPLEVSSLEPGSYTVRANGIEQSFVLPIRDLSQFNNHLVGALSARDYNQLKSFMDGNFMIGYWLSEGTSNSPEQAIELLQRSLLSSSSPVAADPARNLIALLGMDPVTIVGPEVLEARPLFTSGWGAEGRDEAILFVAKRANGDLYWHGLLFAKDGFTKPVPTATPKPVDMNAYPTNVQYVMARQDVNLRRGPGLQFRVIGYIAAGQIVKVTGVNADGSWWRVICPDDSVGSCWVSASRSLTRPADAPLPDNTAYPTDVKTIMAQRDVTMYSGPSNQYSVVGYIAAGQTAKVSGVNASKSWWRVLCPDGSTGSCWVSADPNLTRPADPIPGLADVQSVEIRVLESYPLQVNAVARGMLPDMGCTTIAGASQARSGNTFTVTVTTRHDPLALCAQAFTPFEQVIPLQIDTLLPGTYIVIVNGVQASFELPGSVPPADSAGS
jgi:uncharacterized protein YgiM (DUF1202 family)